jgi:hypothetical protein
MKSAKLCTWLSPSTTLEPLTIVIMGILNSVMPILTDSILLMHILIERIEHSKSPWRLAMTMAAPVFLKFGRLANAAVYISACAEFVLSSVKSGDGVPDMDLLGAAQARSMQVACTLQMIDNSSVDLLPQFPFPTRANSDIHPQLPTWPLLSQRVRETAQGAQWYPLLYIFLPLCSLSRRAETPKFVATTSTTPQGLVALLLASSGTFLLPILLSAAQLAASRRWPDSDLPRDLEQIKVIVNIAGAAATSIVAALKHWRAGRKAAAAAQRDVVIVETNETTPLRTGKKPLLYSRARTRAGRRCVTFDAELIDISMKEDQAQLALTLPVP